jgi:hypothetical protein
MRNKARYLFFSLALIVGLAVPVFALAEEAVYSLEKGMKGIEVGTGYGWSIGSGRHVQSIPLNLRWGCIFTDPMGPSYFRGNWEWLVEGSASYLFHDQNKYGLGINGLIRYNLITKSRLAPFIQGGMGVWYTNWIMDRFPNDFNFGSQGGGGLQYFLNKRTSIMGEYRFQHFSNAGFYSHNKGLNLNNCWFGCAFYY